MSLLLDSKTLALCPRVWNQYATAELSFLSVFPPTQGSEPGGQTWRPAPLPTEPSRQTPKCYCSERRNSTVWWSKGDQQRGRGKGGGGMRGLLQVRCEYVLMGHSMLDKCKNKSIKQTFQTLCSSSFLYKLLIITFIAPAPQTVRIKTKIDEWGYIKLRSFQMTNITVNRQLPERGNPCEVFLVFNMKTSSSWKSCDHTGENRNYSPQLQSHTRMLLLCWNWFCAVCCSHPDFSILFLISYFYLSR